MPRRIIGYAYNEYFPYRCLDLRQGLAPLINPSVLPAFPNYNSGNHLRVSPDKSYAVAGITVASSPNFWLYDDTSAFSIAKTPAVAFAGSIYAVAVGNSFYALGGGSPYLTVFTKSGTVQTVSISGLGTVYYIDFSDDESKMLVVHNTSPYLRIYNTSDWSFVNAATAGSTTYTGCFSHDGTKAYLFSSTVPYIKVVNAATGADITTLSTTAAQAASGNTGSPRVVRWPDGKTILFTHYSATYGIGRLDTTTNTATTFPAVAQVISSAYGILTDPSSNDVYLQHAPSTTGANRALSRFDFTTGVMSTDADENAMYRQFMNSTSGNSAFALVNQGNYQVSGSVRDVNNLPAKRMVRAFKRSSGILCAQTYSDATTGNYTLTLPDSGPYDVQFYTADGELLNDLLYAKVQPEPVS